VPNGPVRPAELSVGLCEATSRLARGHRQHPRRRQTQTTCTPRLAGPTSRQPVITEPPKAHHRRPQGLLQHRGAQALAAPDTPALPGPRMRPVCVCVCVRLPALGPCQCLIRVSPFIIVPSGVVFLLRPGLNFGAEPVPLADSHPSAVAAADRSPFPRARPPPPFPDAAPLAPPLAPAVAPASALPPP
jgi:hypothetical protein